MNKIEFGIEGLSPLKMDRWIDGEQTPTTDEGYREQAPKKCYRDDSGDLAIPSAAIKAAMRLASSRIGKKMEAKNNRQLIRAGIFIEPYMLPLGKKEYDVIAADVVTRGTGDKVTRVKVYRPLIKEWAVEGTMVLYDVTSKFAEESMRLAGFRYGLLSHRPEFGRFKVTKWEVVNNGGE